MEIYPIFFKTAERIQARYALKENGANFCAFFETMTDVIVIGTSNGRVLVEAWPDQGATFNSVI